MSQKVEVQNLRSSPTLSPGFKSYPDYRVSGVRWYEQVPQHWDTSLLGRLGTISGSGIDKKTREDDVPVHMVNYTDVYGNQARELRGGEHLMQTTAPAKKATDHSLEKGDILFTPSSETRDEIGVSAVVMEDLPGTVYSYHLTRFRPHIDLADSFTKYMTTNKAVLSYFESVAEGTTRMTLTQGDFKRAPILLPPREEQEAIGKFLDRVTDRINRLVAKKERLIELLEERRTALITKAVTTGLDPDVPMKDSGVEWLGEIPEHWETPDLGLLLAEPLSYGVLKPDRYEGRDGVPLIRITDVQEGDVNTEDLVHISPEQSRQYHRTVLEKDDVVISVVGTIGTSFVVDTELVGSNVSRALARIALKDDVSPEFLHYFIQSDFFTKRADMILQGTAQRVLNLGDLEEFPVPLPPWKEQDSIVTELDNRCRLHRKAAHKLQAAIDRLQEYRSALITAAVTGKIDLRDYAA